MWASIIRSWMSHGDRVTKLPDGFTTVALSKNAPFAAVADESRNYYAVQFHPEVAHTPHGALLIRNFVRDIAGCTGDWTMGAYREEAIAKIREQVGKERVICGLSGGVDSSVAAVLIHEAIGDQLTCVFVDHGLLRMGEADEVVRLFRDHYNIPLVHVQAQELFLGELEGVSDPEIKRKTIGRLFIDCVRRGGEEDRRRGVPRPGDALPRRDRERVLHRRSLGDDQEPPQCRRPARAHEHATRGAPARTVQGTRSGCSARSSACPRPSSAAIPSPAPASPSAAPAPLRPRSWRLCEKPMRSILDEIRKAGLYDTIWQAFAVILPVKTVGVMGDGRTYEPCLCAPRGHLGRRHDGGFLPLSTWPSSAASPPASSTRSRASTG